MTTPTFHTAIAGEIRQQPDPELLGELEAVRDAAEADLDQVEQLRERADERRRRGEQMRSEAHDEAVRELCRIGALPASECP